MKKMLEEIWQKRGLASAVRFVKWRLENGELVAKTRRLKRCLWRSRSSTG